MHFCNSQWAFKVPLQAFYNHSNTHIKAIIKALRQARAALQCWSVLSTIYNWSSSRDIKKSLNGFNHQILVFENLFSCSWVFAGCARPDDSAKRIRESLERLLECIIWVIIMNSFVSFSSRMNEFIILQILLAVYARFTRVLQNLDENLIFKVNKKDIFSTSRSDVSNMFYESQFLSNVHSTLLLAKYYWIIN